MIHTTKILTSLTLIFLFFGCKKHSNSPSQYMMFDNVSYITEFPQSFELSGREEVNVNAIGIIDFTIQDSLIFVSTSNPDGIISIFTVNNYTDKGKFFKRGNGPFEFSFSPTVSDQMKIVNDGDSLKSCIYDFQKGKLIEVDLHGMINRNEFEPILRDVALPPILFNFIMVNDSTFYCKEIAKGHTQQIRYILKSGERTSTSTLDTLNQAKIRQGEDHNLLATFTKMNYEKEIIVEACVSLNYYNMYSLDGSLEQTIVIGEEIDNLDKVQNTFRWNRPYYHTDLRLFDNFFGVLHINEDEKIYQTLRMKLPKILLFDWDGKPLAELKLDNHITLFDIDFNAGELYTFDNQTDEFFKYDIKDILNKL